MIQRGSKYILAILLVAVSASWAVRSDTATPALENFSRSARLLSSTLPLMHLNKAPWDQSIARIALDNYLEALDFERSFFLQSDIDAFHEKLDGLEESVKRGNLELAFEIYEVFKTRVTDRVAFVETLVGEAMDFNLDETYFWKRKLADWPADEEAWDDLWRRKIKNQLLVRLVETEIGSEEEPSLDEEDEDQRTHTQLLNETLTPEEFVIRQYQRYQNMIRDNDETWVAERFLTAFARAFDPHTDFLSPNNLEDFEINMKLSLVGIGAMLGTEDGAAKIERLIPGGPAEQDGRLQPGDKIIAVAQGDEPPVDVLHWPLYRTVRLIRGEKDTTVVLHVLPVSDPSGSRIELIDIVRDEVKLEEQAAKSELRRIEAEDGAETVVGVITLPDFYADMSGGRMGQSSRSCTRDVQRLLGELVGQGAEALILDLRNNGGGSLTEAISLTGLFIEAGPVVQVRDRRSVRPIYDRNRAIDFDGPLIVLVNRLSASASEIVAGALQDYDRAIIIGDSKTHGKGTVQTLTELASNNPRLGSVKVTTASFYRIAGGSTQLKGILPDIVIPSVFETMEIGEETLDNALPWSTVEPLSYATPPGFDDVRSRLIEQSAARRADDVRFATHASLLERLRERQEQQEITLRLEDRLAFAREQKELQDLIESPSLINGDDSKNNDLALTEALNVAVDWVALVRSETPATEWTGAKAPAARTEPPPAF